MFSCRSVNFAFVPMNIATCCEEGFWPIAALNPFSISGNIVLLYTSKLIWEMSVKNRLIWFFTSELSAYILSRSSAEKRTKFECIIIFILWFSRNVDLSRSEESTLANNFTTRSMQPLDILLD